MHTEQENGPVTFSLSPPRRRQLETKVIFPVVTRETMTLHRVDIVHSRRHCVAPEENERQFASLAD